MAAKKKTTAAAGGDRQNALDAALAMIATGGIADAKTIMLLQYAKLHGLLA